MENTKISRIKWMIICFIVFYIIFAEICDFIFSGGIRFSLYVLLQPIISLVGMFEYIFISDFRNEAFADMEAFFGVFTLICLVVVFYIARYFVNKKFPPNKLT